MTNLIAVILGRKACGKSTAAQKMALKLYAAGRRVIIVDPMDCFRLPGAAVIREAVSSRYANLGGRSVLVRPDSDETADMAFRFSWEAGTLVLFVDEIDKWFSWRDPNPTLLKIIRYGRHRGVSLIGISQRPANIHNDLLAQADVKLIFQTIEPNDLAYLKKYTGLDPERFQELPRFKSLIVRS